MDVKLPVKMKGSDYVKRKQGREERAYFYGVFFFNHNICIYQYILKFCNRRCLKGQKEKFW